VDKKSYDINFSFAISIGEELYAQVALLSGKIVPKMLPKCEKVTMSAGMGK